MCLNRMRIPSTWMVGSRLRSSDECRRRRLSINTLTHVHREHSLLALFSGLSRSFLFIYLKSTERNLIQILPLYESETL